MTTDLLRWLAKDMLDHRVTPAEGVGQIVTWTETGWLPEPSAGETARFRQAEALRQAAR